MKEFEALEQAYQKECFKLDALAIAISEIEAEGIARDTVVALESYCPELISADYPLASYTHFPSKTNLGFAMEGLSDRLLKTAFAAVMKIMDLWIELNRWIAKKILQLVRYSLESKFGNRASSWWDDLKSTMRSESANAAIELYTKLANTQLCQYVEDSADTIPDDETLYTALIEMNEVSVETLDTIISSIQDRRDALSNGKIIPAGGTIQGLIDATKDDVNTLWRSDLNDYGRSIDTYMKNSPVAVAVTDMQLQLANTITLANQNSPKLLDVLQARIRVADYLKSQQRTKQGNLTKIERLYERDLLSVPKIDRLEKLYRVSSANVNKSLDKVSAELDKLMSLKVGTTNIQEMTDYIQTVRAGSATLMRFAKACQYTIVFQNRINDTRGTIVSALNAVLDDAKTRSKQK